MLIEFFIFLRWWKWAKTVLILHVILSEYILYRYFVKIRIWKYQYVRIIMIYFIWVQAKWRKTCGHSTLVVQYLYEIKFMIIIVETDYCANKVLCFQNNLNMNDTYMKQFLKKTKLRLASLSKVQFGTNHFSSLFNS